MPSSSASGHSLLEHTNLERFLDSVTPCLPLHSVPRSRIHGVNSNWLPVGDVPVPYFKLSDLWEGFDEASAYGVGSRVLFGNGDVVTQYYSPFLSAIQLFTNKPYGSARFSSDISWSDDNESEKVSRSTSNHSSPTWEVQSNGAAENNSSVSSDKRGHAYLNYCEFGSPYWRVPFFDKLMELGQTHPELMTLKSVELSPSSWLAVVWYPIYNIPSQTRSKDLSTIFLTYYTLSSSFLGSEAITEREDKRREAKNSLQQKAPKEAKKKMICLRPFGLSTFKMCGDTWAKNESDAEKISSLQSAADSWLKQLSFFHHDFNFYLTHPSESNSNL
uniref:Uncharacterized protein n=1 Tax=Kalanchoe fedtschenkoi TaxID=63787 RepID=A0A7N0U3D4_KALFE